MMRLTCRISDNTEYVQFDNMDGLIRYLAYNYCFGPLFRYGDPPGHPLFRRAPPKGGMRAPGFNTENYIALYWADQVEHPDNDVTNAELQEINRRLKLAANGEFYGHDKT